MDYRNELNEQMSEKKKENLLINENKENDKKERDFLSKQINDEKIINEKKKWEKINLYKAQLDKQIQSKKEQNDDY